MTKAFNGRSASATLLVAFAVFVARICLAADAKPMVFPPLQIFKDLCADAGWSLEDVSKLAEERHLALISSAPVPLPDGGSAHKNVWQAETAVGPIGIIVVAGESKSHGYTEVCSVTAPAYSTDFIQSWLKNSFGEPTSTVDKPQNGSEIHWARTIEDSRIEVTLLTKMPDEKSDLLTIMKHKEVAKGP